MALPWDHGDVNLQAESLGQNRGFGLSARFFHCGYLSHSGAMGYGVYAFQAIEIFIEEW